MEQIISSLNKTFASYDAEVLESSQKWAEGRVTALKEYKKSPEFLDISKKGAWGGMYTKLFDIAGGKTWYSIFSSNSKDGIREFVAKNCAAIINKRNVGIANKLTKAGVKEVLSETYIYTPDGFNGTFVVLTDSGKKIVTIDTIRAGGYNIQCLHFRVLIKIK